ncbi:hypothetical protein CEPID_06245 [Corynebacterium epidermidicanis]|uniref:Uncharacterized protein n=1 Tax=Corynebacterium epidermidicanis TaxID=1050174 RepID=A0A0G3GPQ8_9CORY|nr:hypothetical protein CEPID_06245 [Corynebacterium epidermidicanis]
MCVVNCRLLCHRYENKTCTCLSSFIVLTASSAFIECWLPARRSVTTLIAFEIAPQVLYNLKGARRTLHSSNRPRTGLLLQGQPNVDLALGIDLCGDEFWSLYAVVETVDRNRGCGDDLVASA